MLIETPENVQCVLLEATLKAKSNVPHERRTQGCVGIDKLVRKVSSSGRIDDHRNRNENEIPETIFFALNEQFVQIPVVVMPVTTI